MAHRSHSRQSPMENVRTIVRSIPWKLLLLLPILIALAIPTYLYGTRAGNGVIPAVTNIFNTLSNPPPSATPTPLPPFPTKLPQPGSLLYTVQSGDSCVAILAFQMRMAMAGQVFSDVKPETVKALNASLGRDCHAIQPGMVLPLSPQYPLIAIGGVVLKISGNTPQQVLPTPLIRVSDQQQQTGADCSGGCILTVRLTPQVQVHLVVQTTVRVRVGSWVWAQAMMARKAIRGFDTYPYADPNASFDGMSLRACDVQIDDTHDNNSLSCDQILPNTIDADHGAWLFGVTGTNSLDHWRYHLPLPAGTQVLLWLTAGNDGSLQFRKGNPLYRYDNTTHIYVPV